jgi:hypothetical protein
MNTEMLAALHKCTKLSKGSPNSRDATILVHKN